MKITDIETFVVHPPQGKNMLFVKLTTDNGIAGWGEAYTQTDRDTAAIAHIEQLGRYLEGRDPFNIRHWMNIAYEDFATKRGGMDLWCALSGIEIAMWDIVGKAVDQPVYNLLGGPVRPAIRLYANAWYGGAKTLEEWALAAKETTDKGFTALKFDPLPGPWRAYPNYGELEEAAAVVGAVRDAVGGEVELLIEIHRRLAPMNSIRFAHMIERYRPYWYEEPNPSEHVPALREVRDATDIPVVTGEALYTREEFRDVIDQRAVDILNPDICICGGILELVQIADMAAPHYMAVSPHGNNSTAVGLAAALQASAVMPNFLIYEYFVHNQEICDDISVKPLVPSGSYMELPTDPGIGIELDESKFAKYSGMQYPVRNLRTLEDERNYH